jgi:hypothetical protein
MIDQTNPAWRSIAAAFEEKARAASEPPKPEVDLVMADLLEHPAWDNVLAAIASEARSARRTFFGTPSDDGEFAARARHMHALITAMRSIVVRVYTQAGREVPVDLAALLG